MISVEDLRFKDLQIVRMGLADYMRSVGKEECVPMPGTDIYVYEKNKWQKAEGWHSIKGVVFRVIKYTTLSGQETIQEVDTRRLYDFYYRNYKEWKQPGEEQELFGSRKQKEELLILWKAFGFPKPDNSP